MAKATTSRKTELTGPLANLGPALRVLRTKANLTQEKLSSTAGLTKAQISNYERGKELPSLPSIEKLLRALRISLHELASALDDVERAPAWRPDGSEEATAIQDDELERIEEDALRDACRGFERYLRILGTRARRDPS